MKARLMIDNGNVLSAARGVFDWLEPITGQAVTRAATRPIAVTRIDPSGTFESCVFRTLAGAAI